MVCYLRKGYKTNTVVSGCVFLAKQLMPCCYVQLPYGRPKLSVKPCSIHCLTFHKFPGNYSETISRTLESNMLKHERKPRNTIDCPKRANRGLLNLICHTSKTRIGIETSHLPKLKFTYGQFR